MVTDYNLLTLTLFTNLFLSHAFSFISHHQIVPARTYQYTEKYNIHSICKYYLHRMNDNSVGYDMVTKKERKEIAEFTITRSGILYKIQISKTTRLKKKRRICCHVTRHVPAINEHQIQQIPEFQRNAFQKHEKVYVHHPPRLNQ